MKVRHEGRSRARSGATADRREGGETLIELLATIVLMSVGIAALITGLFTVIRASDQANRQSTANLGVHGYAEFLKDSVVGYKPCATPSGANSYPGYTGAPTGYTARVVSIAYWDGTLDSTTRAPKFVGSCSTDNGLQQITVEVASDDTNRPAVERIVISKRDQRCLVAYQGSDGKPC